MTLQRGCNVGWQQGKRGRGVQVERPGGTSALDGRLSAPRGRSRGALRDGNPSSGRSAPFSRDYQAPWVRTWAWTASTSLRRILWTRRVRLPRAMPSSSARVSRTVSRSSRSARSCRARRRTWSGRGCRCRSPRTEGSRGRAGVFAPFGLDVVAAAVVVHGLSQVVVVDGEILGAGVE